MEGHLSTDVLIVGGGLVGGTLGCALATGGLRSIVIDRDNVEQQDSEIFDGRATAVSQTAMKMLQTIGVWTDLNGRASPILDIRVADGHSHLFLHFNHQDVSEEALGYMIENQFLRRAIFHASMKRKEITNLMPVEVVDLQRNADGIRAVLADGRVIQSALLVGADGRNSIVRQHAEIPVTQWSYKQAGIVCTVTHQKPHNNVAHEHFFPAGPFAILPLTENRSSIVWTEGEDEARILIDLPADEFLDELTQRFGNFLGHVRVVGPVSSYPLRLQYTKSNTALRMALVGDSAHSLHPIAGQGLNMGFRDVAALAEVLVDAHRLGLDIGAPHILKQYERWRRFDNTLMLAATDGLNRLFSNDVSPVRLVRDFGLAAVNASGFLKRIFMHQAMGLTGSLPRLLRGEAL